MTTQLPTTDQQDVLTLHRGIYQRWLAESGQGMAPRQVQTGLSLSSGRLMAHLPGLASMSGTFGSQAWDLATSVAHSPQWLGKLGLDARTLQIGDLADLLQLVLEEEEQTLEAATLEAAMTRTAAAAKGQTAAKTAQRKTIQAAPTRTAQARTATRKPAPGQASKLRAIRQLLADLRIRENQATAASGAFAPEAAGQVGRADPAQVGTELPHAGTAHLQALGLGAAPASRGLGHQAPARSIARLAQAANQGRSQADRWLDPFARAQDVAAMPRALRMAEQAAELALLEPGLEGRLNTGEVGEADLVAVSATGRAATPATGRTGASVAASAGRTAHAATLARSPDVRLPAAAWAASVARQSTATAASASTRAVIAQAIRAEAMRAQTYAATTQAQAFARISVAGSAAGRLPAGAPASAAASGALASAAASGAPASAATPAREGFAAVRAQAGQAGPAASFFSGPAFAGPVAWAARQLGKIQRFEAVASGDGRTQRRAQAGVAQAASAMAGRDLPGLAPASTAAGSVVGALTPQADRFAPLFERGGADLSRGQAILPRWAAWLAQGEAALAGKSVQPAARRGYAGLAQGAGDWLQPAAAGADGVFGESDPGSEAVAGTVARASARSGPAAVTRVADLRETARVVAAAGRTAGRASALPAWIAPVAALNAASTRGSAAMQAAQTLQGQPGQAAPFTSAQALQGQSGQAAPFASAQVLQGQAGQAAPFASAQARQAQAAGAVGLSAIGLGTRLSGRLLAGLEPVTSGLEAGATAWIPRTLAHATAPGQIGGAGADSAGNASAAWTAGVADSPFAAGTRAARGYAGGLGADAGAGEWLAPGAEQDFAGEADRGSEVAGTARNVAQAKAAAGRASALGAATAAGRAPSRSTTARGVGATAARPGETLAARQSRIAALSGRQTAWAGAAAAAIERVVAQSARNGRLTELVRHIAQGRSVVDFANGAEAQVLAARPFGASDAVTPWIEQHLARQQVRAMASASSDERVSLQPGADAGADTETNNVAVLQSNRSEAVRNRVAATAGARAEAKTKVASGSLDAMRSPAAVRAALALFGDSLPQGGADVATAFLARWFGRADVLKQTTQAPASTGRPGAVLTLQGESASAPAQSAAARAMAPRSAAAGAETGGEFVLTGLAALSALQGSRGDLEQMGAQGATRAMRTEDTEREMLAPGATSAAVESSEGAAASPVATGRVARKGTTAQLHDFVPVGLRRGRDLLSSTRRAAGLMRITPRTGFERGLGRGGIRSRAGYGSAELGGGDLVGLGAGDTASFHGESGPMPSAVRGADRLSGIVEARRNARTGRGHAAAVAAGQGPQRTFTGGDGPQGLPTDFNYGEQSLVNPAAAMQAAVSQSGRNQGASASMRSVQAGAMARVLSVTSTPGANMLPLVAPAASALVAAAAAKPLSESIVTSGADATVGMPMQDMGGNGNKKNGKGGGGEASHDGQGQAEDIDALAQKIARSVMTRIKRERERRGIHG